MPIDRPGSWAAPLAVCLLLGLATSTAQAATIYVDPQSKGGACRNSHSVKQASKQSTPWCALKYAFDKAPVGTKLILRGGLHKAVLPGDIKRSPSRLTLTERVGERAVLTQVRLNRCSRISFRGLTLRYVRLEHCSGSSFIDNEVTSHGLWAFFSNDLRFVGNKLHDTDNGIILGSDRRVLIERNDFRRIPRPSYKADGGDGIQANTMVKLTIRKNTFDEFLAHAHTDSIEFAASNDQVTIDSNVWHQSRGIISVPHPHRPAAYSNTRWKIVNNEFTFMTQWALELNNVPKALIANNTTHNTGHGIRLHGLTSGVVMANNITDVAAADKASYVGRSTGNVIGKLETAYPLGAGDVLGKATFGDPSKFNFRLLAGSLGIDFGAADVAPKRDRLGRERVGRPDAGAYEFRP